MYMSKEILMDKAVKKLKEVAAKDLATISSREKAIHSTELERLYNDLSPMRRGSEVAGMIADDCMQMKVKLAESDMKVPGNDREKRAKVIMNGLNESSYDIPWLRQ